jgi:hypothetical protein
VIYAYVLDITKGFPLTRDLCHVYVFVLCPYILLPYLTSKTVGMSYILQGFGGWDFEARFMVFT